MEKQRCALAAASAQKATALAPWHWSRTESDCRRNLWSLRSTVATIAGVARPRPA